MANVNFVREDVALSTARWNVVKHCLIGEKAVKGAGDLYLPRPNASDKSAANKARYAQYIERAVFYNVTQRTHAGLVGQVFVKDPIVKVGALMEPLLVDIDGAGVSLDQQSKKALGEVLAYGRCGLLVDYPPAEEPASRQDVLDGHARATITLYDPWNVINWRTVTVGARIMLSLVVIAESYVVEDDGFEIRTADQWRVLRLEKGTGVYRVELWRIENGQAAEHTHYYPKDASGEYLREIPFKFVGAVNNDPNIDLSPLYDLASLNIAHYRNSADYEESCFLTGQPTPVFSGLTKDWVDDVFKGTIQLGSRAAIPLPVGGSAALLQATANTMPFEAMQHKERQMVALGAKLVEQKQVQRTLGEAMMDESSESSILSTCAKNVADAYRLALGWCAAFIGDSSLVEFDLNTDFDFGLMSAEERAELIKEWQAGAISFTEMRFSLKRANVAYLEDEEAREEIEGEMASGMGVGAALLLATAKGGNKDEDDEKNPKGGATE